MRNVKRQARWRVIASLLVVVFLWAVIVPAYGNDATVAGEETTATAPVETVEEVPAAEPEAPAEEVPEEAEAPAEEAPAEEAPAEETEALLEEAPAEAAVVDEPAVTAELEEEAEVADVAEPYEDTIPLTGLSDVVYSEGGYIYDGECEGTLRWHFVVTQVAEGDAEVTINFDSGTKTPSSYKSSGGVRHFEVYTEPGDILYLSGSEATALFQGNGNPQFNLSSVECIEGGNIETGEICVYKFYDEDGDGEWDSDEDAISGWEFSLYNMEDELIDSGTTDSGGELCFRGLDCDEYMVVEVLPEDWEVTTEGGVSQTCDLECPVLNGPTINQINGDGAYCELVFGNREVEEEVAEICAYKFLDLNGNGVPDDVDEGEDEEVPMADVEFMLEMLDDEMWVEVDVETSGEDGYACFGDFPAGTYRITEDPPEGYMVVGDNPKMFEHDGESDITVNFGNEEVPDIEDYDIDVEKVASVDTVAPGGAITYTITMTNTGLNDLIDVVVTDDYEEDLVSVTDAGGGVVGGGMITWNIALLEPGDDVTFMYTVLVDADVADGTIIDNTVVAENEEASDQDDEDVEVVVTPIVPELPEIEVVPEVTRQVVTRPVTTGVVTEPFLPFTGADAGFLGLLAGLAGTLGLGLRRRSRRMRRE